MYKIKKLFFNILLILLLGYTGFVYSLYKQEYSEIHVFTWCFYDFSFNPHAYDGTIDRYPRFIIKNFDNKTVLVITTKGHFIWK